MRLICRSLAIASLAFVAFVAPSEATTLHDYRGTLGTAQIGLTIAAKDLAVGESLSEDAVLRAHYFYISKLANIPLELVKFDGRNISFEERDTYGNHVAIFKLNFATQDPQHHFVSKEDLRNEVLVGSWIPASGPVHDIYLKSEDEVSGDEEGGRCDLDTKAYARLQDRVLLFYRAALKYDAATLKKEFKIKIPKQASWHKELARSVPHDLFCNAQGFMLGRGIVWFNPDGTVLTINNF